MVKRLSQTDQGSTKIVNLADPTNAQDAATKKYVDDNAGTGDVVGPSSSVDNTVPRFDGTTGKLIQGSGLVVGDPGDIDDRILIDSPGPLYFEKTLRIAGDPVVSTTNTVVLTNKTLSAPKVDYIKDANGYKNTEFSAASGTPVNYLSIINSTSTNPVVLAASGTDTNIDLELGGKGTGKVKVGGVEVATISASQTLTNKNLTSGTNTFPTFNQNTTGSAATLTTARTVRTNLASTSTASFDGSANVTPGVTGTLPVGNGGTGATTLTGILKGNGTSAVTAVTAPSGAIVGTTDTQTLTNKTLTQESWTAVTFQNSWTDYDTTNFYPCAYMKDSMGFVHLRGMARSGTTGSAIFTLPAGYRPSKVSYHSAPNAIASGVGTVNIAGTGVVKIDTGNNTYQSFDGIVFKAEQ